MKDYITIFYFDDIFYKLKKMNDNLMVYMVTH